MPRDTVLDERSAAILGLLEATREAVSAAERRFVLLNHSRATWPYQVALLWSGGAVAGHSGAGQIEPLGPYAQWLDRLLPALSSRQPGPVQAADVEAELAEGWREWWPDHALWLLAGPQPGAPALLLVRDVPWRAAEVPELGRWLLLWNALDEGRAAAQASGRWLNWTALRAHWHGPRRTRALLGTFAVLAGLACVPVHQTVRAPGELVPRDPVVLRAAVDGTVRALKVEPNQAVQAGQVLAELDDAGWASRLQVAQQSLLTAEAEWRQTSQQALSDARAKAQLAAAQGKYEERRAEVTFLTQQVQRTTVLAPHDGVVLIQDPGSWPGRTVVAGEALMKLARPGDQEVEAWLAVGDAIDLPDGAPMQLHLGSRPAEPVEARLRMYAYEAEHRPDTGLGHRLRGTLDGPVSERLGARGTVRLEGPRVPLIYWVLRRPLAALRETTGW